ncbi:hypothetical protein MYX82_08870 [Acidobacteria bacterium AH-259-D05]|nr:hypothetical protein [Acidobacteria bacterium AH-259-D05]
MTFFITDTRVGRIRLGKYSTAFGLQKLLACLVVSSFVAAAFPQTGEANPEEGGVEVNLGFSAAMPGHRSEIPLTLSAPQILRISTVSSQISFSRNLLTFLKAGPGLSGELSGAQIRTVVKDDEGDPNLSILEVTVSGGQAMRPGILAYLTFEVSGDAKESVIRLETRDTKVTTENGESIKVNRGKDGEITISENIDALFACFFYMH